MSLFKMLSLFFIFCHSYFLEYSRSAFDIAITQVEETPVFVLFYLESEPVSTRVIGRYKDLMNQTTDRAVGFSVECSEQFELCNDLNAQYFPSIIAMRSVYSFYHRLYHGNFTPSSLITFVETVIDPPIQYLDSLGSIDLLSDGFMNVTVPVYFGPNAKPKGEEFIPFLTNLSNFIYAANRTFATYYDSSEHMKIYISPNCGLLYNGPMNQKSILKFMEDYKYPILHKFTYEQFSTYHPDVPMLAILSTRPLSEEYASILSDVSSKLCGKFIFGWLDPFSDRRYNITFKNDPEDPTLFAYVDRTNHKIFKLLKRPDTQIVHQFVLNVTHFYEQGEDWDNGWAIFGAFILLILTSIFLLVYNSTYQKCISNINELFF